MKAKTSLKQIQKKKPIILCITNHVTMDFVANVLLAIGASPIMSESEDEIDELVNICDAVVINIGTLSKEFISFAEKVAILAKQKNKPVVLDPVGAGASKVRTDFSIKLLNYAQVVRANSSEIYAIHNNAMTLCGIDASNSHKIDRTLAIELSLKTNAVIAMSGVVDCIANSNSCSFVEGGSELMPKVTGMGCSLTAVIAAFLTVEDNNFNATINAMHFFARCGEKAAKKTSAPASFKTSFIDNLYLTANKCNLK